MRILTILAIALMATGCATRTIYIMPTPPAELMVKAAPLQTIKSNPPPAEVPKNNKKK